MIFRRRDLPFPDFADISGELGNLGELNSHEFSWFVQPTMNVYFGSCKLNSQVPLSIHKSFALSALLTGFSVHNRFR